MMQHSTVRWRLPLLCWWMAGRKAAASMQAFHNYKQQVGKLAASMAWVGCWLIMPLVVC